MKATAEIQAIPIGAGVSVRREVQRAHELLEESGLIVETHASGTNVEGDLAQILQAVERVHAVLHAEGTVRLITVVKLRDANRQSAHPRWQAPLTAALPGAEDSCRQAPQAEAASCRSASSQSSQSVPTAWPRASQRL